MTRQKAIRLGSAIVLLHMLAGMFFCLWTKRPLRFTLDQEMHAGKTNIEIDYWSGFIEITPDPKAEFGLSVFKISLTKFTPKCKKTFNPEVNTWECLSELNWALSQTWVKPVTLLSQPGKSPPDKISLPVSGNELVVIIGYPLPGAGSLGMENRPYRLIVLPHFGFRGQLDYSEKNGYLRYYPSLIGCLEKGRHPWLTGAPLGHYPKKAKRTSGEIPSIFVSRNCFGKNLSPELVTLKRRFMWAEESGLVWKAKRGWYQPSDEIVCSTFGLFLRDSQNIPNQILEEMVAIPPPLSQSPSAWEKGDFDEDSKQILGCICNGWDGLNEYEATIFPTWKNKKKSANGFGEPVSGPDQMLSLIHFEMFREKSDYSPDAWMVSPEGESVGGEALEPVKRTDEAYWQEHKVYWKNYCDTLPKN